MAAKTSQKKWIRAASNFFALIPSRSNWKYWRIFLVSNSKWLKQLYHCSEREKRKSFSHVHSSFIQRKTRKFQVVFVKQWQRNAPKSACAARAKLLFCCFSAVLVAVAVAVAKAPQCCLKMAPLKNAKLRCTAWNWLILRESRVAWNNKVSTKDKTKIVGK